MLYYILRFIFQPIFWLFWRPVVVGRKNLCVKGKAIFVSNHVSLRDPVLIALISPRFIHFMGKSELFENIFLGLFLRAFLVFPVKRKTADMQSIKKALSLLEKGKVFGIFPEGHRSKTGETAPFEKGTAFMAVHSDSPVIPMYIPKSTLGFFKRPHIYVGAPLTVSDDEKGLRKSETMTIMTEKMQNAVADLRSQWENSICK